MKKDIKWLRNKLVYLHELDMWNWKQCEPNSKERSHFYGCLTAYERALDFLDELDEPEMLMRAWLYGYTAEEEQKFYVYLGDGQYLVSEDDLKEPYVKIRHQEDGGFLNYNMTFTEQEIKGYDERYWPFHKPVEDMMSRLFRESNELD